MAIMYPQTPKGLAKAAQQREADKLRSAAETARAQGLHAIALIFERKLAELFGTVH